MGVDNNGMQAYTQGQTVPYPQIAVAPRSAAQGMPKTPAEQIADALRQQLPAALVFRSEDAATAWAAEQVAGVLRYKFDQMQLPPADRNASDPIDAGYIHAKDLGTRPRRQRIQWMDAMVKEVAEACFCELVPLSGTLSSWLIGRKSDRMNVLQLVGSLIPTSEALGQDAYLKEYHAHRRAGEVEQARGFKTQYHLAQIERLHEAFAQQASAFTHQHPDAGEAFRRARLDITEYMNDNFLQTRGNRNERRNP